jgi:Zn finger protein HypA/HybF involved in hydrogenase expression
MKLTFDGDKINIEDAVWCSQCGNQLFYGNSCYIYEDKIYCPYCAGSNDIIQDAIEMVYVSTGE